MPARNITFNGVPNLFEWQVGNTTRFIKFNDITDVKKPDKSGTFDVEECYQSIHIVPASEYKRFNEQYRDWCHNMMQTRSESANE